MRTLNKLSIVVPCHNEEEVLPSTHARLSAILTGLVDVKKCREYEIIYVNNGSTDRTRDVMDGLFQKDAHVRIIELRRNFGYQGSISAGLFYSEGDAVVTIDSDLQDPPEKIGEMVDHFCSGYDLVLGVRSDRTSDTFFKRVTAHWYYNLLKFFQVEVVYNHGDFRLMARALVDEFNQLPERNRLIRAMILKLDDRYAVVSYAREKRELGMTKFNIFALLSLSLDGILSFSYAPLRLASIFGILMCLCAFAGMVLVVYIKFDQHVFPGWASTLLPIIFFGGVQLLVLGIIGEYMGRLYTEVKGRPIFSVRRQLRRESGSAAPDRK